MKLRIIEGYEIVGKSTYIKSLEGKQMMNFAREFGIDGLNTGQYGIGFINSWIVGAELAKLGAKDYLKDDTYNLDRGILSTMVYGKIQGELFKAKGYIKQYVKDLIECNCEIIYIHHTDMVVAEKMFNNSRKRTTTDEYDKFDSFQEYWLEYLKFDQMFRDAIDILKSGGLTNIIMLSTSEIYNEDMED